MTDQGRSAVRVPDAVEKVRLLRAGRYPWMSRSSVACAQIVVATPSAALTRCSRTPRHKNGATDHADTCRTAFSQVTALPGTPGHQPDGCRAAVNRVVTASLDQGCDAVGCVLLKAGDDVGVDVQGEGHGRVTQAFAHDLRRDAGLKSQARMRVS